MFTAAGKTMMRVAPAEFAQYTNKLTLLGIGANCGVGPAEILHSVQGVDGVTTHYIVAKANCGIPQFNKDFEIEYPMSPDYMAAFALFARDAGATIIGGCCGTTPLHIKAMHAALNNTPHKNVFDLKESYAILGKPWPQKTESKGNRRGNPSR